MALLSSQSIPALLLLITAIIGILLLVLQTQEIHKTPEYEFGIVMDAGSSHTSMYVYKWLEDKQNGTGIVTQHDECHVKGGGISSYAGVPGGAAKSLDECLKQAMTNISRSKHQRTPLYLRATAGMRLLERANATESQRILKEVGTKLQSYPFSFKGANILSGREEGAYGWVTVNYLLENLAKYGFVSRWLNPGKATMGALDLGGASTQITFETSENIENPDNGMALKLFGRTYNLYTQSFLCYGQDQVLRKLLAQLIKVQGLKDQLSHPCYPPHYTTSILLGTDVFNSPCTAMDRPPSLDPQKNVSVVGTGDYRLCRETIHNMFSFNTCKYSHCSIDGVFHPKVFGSFMAFSAYYFTHSYIQTLTNISIMSPRHMKEGIQRVCNMSITKMSEKTKQPEKYMKNVCAVSNFIHILLTEAYGFNDTSLPEVSFRKQAGAASVGWALGFMLHTSSLLPTEGVSVMKVLPAGPWTALLLLFIFLIIMSVLMLGMSYRRKRQRGDICMS